MKELEKSYGVVYIKKIIIAIKNPQIEIYPAKEASVYECETLDEVDAFIVEEGLQELAFATE